MATSHGVLSLCALRKSKNEEARGYERQKVALPKSAFGGSKSVRMNDLSWFWMAALAAVTLYCAVQAVRDFRAKRYLWAVVAALSATLLLIMPIGSHAIKIDLPISN